MTRTDNEPVPDTDTLRPAGQAGLAEYGDVGAQLSGWIREARQLAEQQGLDSLATALGGLAAQRRQSMLKVAVLGEFNRGKSALINTLLGRPILPVGRLPVTRTAVRLRDASADALRLDWPDGRVDLRRLDEADAWRGLLGLDADPAGADEGPPPEVTVEVANTWLHGLRIELIDTPGANTGGARQLDQVQRIAASADAVLFVVSAISPLGTSERELIEQEALHRHVSHIWVALTMLDLVEPAERDEALRQTRDRVVEFAAHARVLPAPAPGETGPALDSLRSVLRDFAQDDDRGLWRDRRIAATVADHCETLTRMASEALALAQLSEQERASRAAAARTERDRDERAWRQLGIDLTARRLEHARLLRELMQSERASTLEYLHNELEQSADPRAWWERDLPLQIRRDLAVTARKTERSILGRLAGDAAWLDAEVRRRLPGAAAITTPSEYGLTANAQIDGQVSDLSRTRLAARLSAQGGALIGYLVALTRHARMPVLYGTAFSLLAGLLAENSIRSATEAQRREIDAALVRIVDESLDSFVNQASDALDTLYTQVLSQLQAAHTAWSDAYLALLETPQDSDTAAAWLPLAEHAAQLAARIRAALADPKEGER